MIKVIGLFNQPDNIETAVANLQAAGLGEKQVHILSDSKSICELLDCNPINVILTYAMWGALIGVGIYGGFGITAALCQCNLMQFGIGYGIGTFLWTVLGGIFVGGFLGLLAGAGKADEKTHYYIEGLRRGGKVIALDVPEKAVEQVRHILEMSKALGIKIFEAQGV